MDKETTIEDVLREWVEIYEHENLDPLLQYYRDKYQDVKIIDYAIEGNSIFITPEKDLDVIKVTLNVDNWEE